MEHHLLDMQRRELFGSIGRTPYGRPRTWAAMGAVFRAVLARVFEETLDPPGSGM